MATATKAIQSERTVWSVANDIEDIIIGLERAQKVFYIPLGDLNDDFFSSKAFPDFLGKDNLENYCDGFSLTFDCVSDECERLQALLNELFELERARRREGAAK
ncbi:hypothetical protein [Ruminococcus sp.]|uniref:hypothetical protein n=1 Tax=Ruminococcus sp. TaxID=41978 RepID=UPI0038684C58